MDIEEGFMASQGGTLIGLNFLDMQCRREGRRWRRRGSGIIMGQVRFGIQKSARLGWTLTESSVIAVLISSLISLGRSNWYYNNS